MMEPPVDLTALRLESGEHERLVARILAAAGSELERRAGVIRPTLVLEAWSRPILAFAASIVLIATATYVWPSPTLTTESPVATLAEELSVPTPVSSWVTEGREPTTEDLLVWIADAGR